MANFLKRSSASALVLVLITSLVVTLAANTSQAAPARSGTRAQGLGAGLMIGTFDSITGKYVLPSGNAIDFGMAFWLMPWNAVYGDYLFNIPGLFGSNTPFTRQTIGYLGLGGGLSFWNGAICTRYYCGTAYRTSGAGFFARGFFGAEWYAGQAPFAVFAEIGPTIGMIPGFGSAIDIGIGGRFFF